MQSIFILNHVGEVIIERHYRGLITRTICDTFWDEISKKQTDVKASASPAAPPSSTVSPSSESEAAIQPVIATSKYNLVHVKRNNLYFLAVLVHDSSPLLVIEFLNRAADVFKDYFSGLTEELLKDNFVTVYQLLDEMCDGGNVMTLEPNMLWEMIGVPSLLSGLKDQIGTRGPKQLSSVLPDGTTSTVYWRRQNAKYTANELYMDIVEEIDAVLDKSGAVIKADVIGSVQVQSHLSAMPDLTLRFTNPRLLDDVAFHPCVRLARWLNEQIISFVPPDGAFTLMQFIARGTPGATNQSSASSMSSSGAFGSHFAFPLFIQPVITFNELGGKVHIQVVPKLPSPDRVLENVALTIPFPKSIGGSATLSANVGQVHYDEISKVCKWTIGKIGKNDKIPVLEGTVSLISGQPVPESNPIILVDFLVLMHSTSGLKVDSLNVHNVTYNPYKGVRAITKAGKFQIRS
eukprot:TRINITY_DN5397_c0_g2_i1.p1 TRINITY_DN5397_c0_g2~~TRINITY_DN5397_c0_g2_i1.p1  ORF type:complete len:462 (-),score=163.81 TRINITY_DN5397_c0_g2_i1:92-1477(-)